ncbi:B12-binding domain-containing radical SAM protein [Paenibacillus xylanexedens]|uniref:B12-binding domain-containing radical SAM protein n=1 Tax=Paenibacillus xylanexedens TaxID=528191 RepID=UPI001C9310AB|nr:radical SAM protein [Paenibacillus xylanexedens]
MFSTERFSDQAEITRSWAAIGVQVQWIWRLIPELPSIRILGKEIRIDKATLIHSREGAVQIILCEAISNNGQAVQEVILDEFFYDAEWRNRILLSGERILENLDRSELGNILAHVISGVNYMGTRTNTAEQRYSLYNPGKLLLTPSQQLMARDRILFEFQSPPVQQRGRILWIFANPYTDLIAGPYGLDILNGISREHGYQTRLVNPFLEYLEPEQGLKEIIRDFEPDLIGLSLRNMDDALIIHSLDGDSNAVDTQDLLRSVRTLVEGGIRGYDGPVIMGGAAFGTAPKLLLDYFGLHYGVIGAADEAIGQLCSMWRPCDVHEKEHRWQAGFHNIWRNLPGAVWTEGNEFHHCPASTSRVLDQSSRIRRTLPYTLMNRKEWMPEPVRGAQGCALGCSYCLESVNRKVMSWRSVEDVVDEMEFSLLHYGIQVFHLADSEANLPFRRLTDLAKEILRRGLEKYILWTAYLNVKPFDTSAIPLLISAGLYRFKFAIDHFHNNMLTSYNKNFREKDIEVLLDKFQPFLNQTQFYAGILLGGPGENEETLNYAARRMQDYTARGFTFYYNVGVRIYPGTPYAELWKKSRDKQGYYGPGQADEALSPLVYCAPESPRVLAAKLEKRFEDDPNVFRMNQERVPLVGYEAYRKYLVAWQAWLVGREEEAASILDSIPNLSLLKKGEALRRLLRMRSRNLNKHQMN